MNLGELRERLVDVMDLDGAWGVNLHESKDVLIYDGTGYAAVESAQPTFVNGRFALALVTGEPERPLGTGCCKDEGVDCHWCLTGRCSECRECVHFDDSARDDGDGFYEEDEDPDQLWDRYDRAVGLGDVVHTAPPEGS